MRCNILAAALATILITPVVAAPAPAPLEVALTFNIPEPVVPHQNGNVNLRFSGATPDAFYDLNVPVNGQKFTIDHPEVSVSSIVIFGFGICELDGIDGSHTQLASFGTPQVVPVGPPQVQVSGVCKDIEFASTRGLYA